MASHRTPATKTAPDPAAARDAERDLLVHLEAAQRRDQYALGRADRPAGARRRRPVAPLLRRRRGA